MSKEKMNELDLFRYELIFDGTTGEEFAKSIGMSYPSYKNVVRDGSKVIPKWVLAFLFGRGYSYVGGALVKLSSDIEKCESKSVTSVQFGVGTTITTTTGSGDVTYNGSVSCVSVDADGVDYKEVLQQKTK